MGLPPEEDPAFSKLRRMRGVEREVTEKLDTLRENISKEVRALHNGRDGRQYSLRDIAASVGVRHGTVHGWLQRGAGVKSKEEVGDGPSE